MTCNADSLNPPPVIYAINRQTPCANYSNLLKLIVEEQDPSPDILGQVRIRQAPVLDACLIRFSRYNCLGSHTVHLVACAELKLPQGHHTHR